VLVVDDESLAVVVPLDSPALRHLIGMTTIHGPRPDDVGTTKI
jgi:hypothetical protein